MIKPTLVVVDAVSSSSDDENEDVALPNIQKLIDSGLARRVYEFCYKYSLLKHEGCRIDKPYVERKKELGLKPEDLSDDIILAGGSLGNGHLEVFVSLLKQLRDERRAVRIHFPTDCTYSLENHYDSVENWNNCIIGDSKMLVLNLYREAAKEYACPAYVSKINGEETERTPVTEL